MQRSGIVPLNAATYEKHVLTAVFVSTTLEHQPLDLTTAATAVLQTPEALEVDFSEPFSIGDVQVDSRVVLAPMAGVSVQAFRRQGRRHGAGLVCSEMVSACGLHYNNERTQNYLRIADDEHPIAVQLFGTDPQLMADAAQQAVAAGADVLDINMGCPVKKVTKTSAGCKMLDDHDLAVEVARAVVDASSVPVMIKLRRGMANGSFDCLTLGPRLVEESGVSALTIHPRSAAQMYTGFADHAITKMLVDVVDVPVFASGDITDRDRARFILAHTGAAAVMIGRAAQGNPWVLPQILQEFVSTPTIEERIAEHVRFVREVVREMGAERSVGFLRKFHGWYLRGGEFRKETRNTIMRMEDPQEVEDLLLGMYPAAQPHLDVLERESRYPDETDRTLNLPISIYGGG